MTRSSSFLGAEWIPVVPDPSAVARLRASGLSDVAARCAAIRWNNLDAPPPYDRPSFDHLEDPFAMRGMDAALDRLRRAVADRQRIRIITDYDVDGTTSSLILQATLKLAGGDAAFDYHIPDRFTEGYGFSAAAADAAADAGVDLIVTADIGVRDHAAIARAVERGVDVLVCDHHLPRGAAVPSQALVLCPPQAGCTYPNPHLAACGISLKLAQALLADHPKRDVIVASLLKLAAIGTVADMVPLTTPENRAIVALGLVELNRGPHNPGLQALLEACRLNGSAIEEGDLGFRVGPRINAAGRMADASLVVELLTSRDPARARDLAAQVETHNQDRRRVQERLVKAALEAVPDPPGPFVVLGGPEEEGWHRGVVGIVASRVKDEVHRPVAVLSIQGDKAVGSVRSVRGVHAVAALESAADLLVKFGGHPAAAGFTVPTANLAALEARLCAFVGTHAPDLGAICEVDAEVSLDRLDQALHDELATLGPFGMGNPRPSLMLREVRVRDLQLVGNTRRMVRFRVPRPDGRGGVEAVWWDRPDLADDLTRQPVDLLGTLGVDRWNGRTKLQFRVKDARPAR